MLALESKFVLEDARNYPGYLENLRKYLLLEEADETILRGFEEDKGIPEQGACDFRRQVACYLWAEEFAQPSLIIPKR
jgi:hypothetical protein